MDCIVIEILPKNRRERSLIIANIYSPPKQRKNCGFGEFFAKLEAIAQKNPLVIEGDFNAQHTTWGYPRTTGKGRELWHHNQQQEFILLTDPLVPTRRGNSVTKDTSPDLSIISNETSATWCNTGEDLGSDHRILEIVIHDGPRAKENRTTKAISWTVFREERQSCGDIGKIEDWNEELLMSVQKATEELEVDANINKIDNYMRNLWRQKRELESRLEARRGDRNLRNSLL